MLRKLDTQKTRSPEDSLKLGVLFEGFLLLEATIRNRTA